MNSLIQSKKRVDWIDFAKGVTMILTIIGHTVGDMFYGTWLRAIIFSFHMPLYFILSCTTFRCSTSLEEWKTKTVKAFKHLMIPALAIFLFNLVATAIQYPEVLSDYGFYRNAIYTFLYASGTTTKFIWFDVPAIGMIWFFFALFLGRSLFDYLHYTFEREDHFVVILSIFSILGYILSQLDWVPFSLDLVLIILPFFYFGYKLKDIDLTKISFKNYVFMFLFWAGILWAQMPDYNVKSYMELAARRFTLYPLSFFGAMCATVLILRISQLFCKLKKLAIPFVLIGKNSLYMFYIHILDTYWINLWNVPEHQFDTALKRVIVDLAVFAVFLLIKTLFNKKVTD